MDDLEKRAKEVERSLRAAQHNAEAFGPQMIPAGTFKEWADDLSPPARLMARRTGRMGAIIFTFPDGEEGIWVGCEDIMPAFLTRENQPVRIVPDDGRSLCCDCEDGHRQVHNEALEEAANTASNEMLQLGFANGPRRCVKAAIRALKR